MPCGGASARRSSRTLKNGIREMSGNKMREMKLVGERVGGQGGRDRRNYMCTGEGERNVL